MKNVWEEELKKLEQGGGTTPDGLVQKENPWEEELKKLEVTDVSSSSDGNYFEHLLDHIGDILDIALVMDDNKKIKQEFVYSKTNSDVILQSGHEALNKAFIYARTPRLIKDNEGNIDLFIGDTHIMKVYQNHK